MTDFYQFRVTGDIGPVICSAVPELNADPAERSVIFTGSVTGVDELACLLERLEELHLVETDIRLHHAAAPAGTGVAAEKNAETPPEGPTQKIFNN